MIEKTVNNRRLEICIPCFPDVQSLISALQPNYSIYCFRPKILAEKVKQFISLFPGTVIYALKCNPQPIVVDALYQAGIRGFDIASEAEFSQISNAYKDAKSYFMHPVKSRAAIKSAYWDHGIRHFVVDHYDELEKILQETGGEDVVIMVRLKTPASQGSFYNLSKKFGAEPNDASSLIKEAERHGCKTGITFHVGSQCIDPKAYSIALDIVGEVIHSTSIQPICIDVGGGFPNAYPGTNVPPLEDYITEIKQGLNRLRLSPQTQVIAEPGRALVASSCSLLVQVQLRKKNQLYINDGIYGGLSELYDSKIQLPARVVRINDFTSNKLEEFYINGATCDSADMLPTPLKLSNDVREGDWIEIDQIGAYSNSSVTRFNGLCSEAFSILYDEPPSKAALSY
ncbi:putative ornithine decarboxylase [Cylindrospermum sp. NIES-4074]|nr:putative ornithine decarboxylase [Cylindrospermum sp. NIES-4074]